MTSWRETASAEAQDDLDGLLNEALRFAEQTLSKYGEMFPFGASVSTEGVVAMMSADPGLGEQPPSEAVLRALYDGARASSSNNRAVAFVADVRANGSDAVRVDLEHAEGAALVVLVPYSRGRFKKTVTFGQLSAGPGEPKIWAAR